jgi:hypothetical protein
MAVVSATIVPVPTESADPEQTDDDRTEALA